MGAGAAVFGSSDRIAVPPIEGGSVTTDTIVDRSGAAAGGSGGAASNKSWAYSCEMGLSDIKPSLPPDLERGILKKGKCPVALAEVEHDSEGPSPQGKRSNCFFASEVIFKVSGKLK